MKVSTTFFALSSLNGFKAALAAGQLEISQPGDTKCMKHCPVSFDKTEKKFGTYKEHWFSEAYGAPECYANCIYPESHVMSGRMFGLPAPVGCCAESLKFRDRCQSTWNDCTNHILNNTTDTNAFLTCDQIIQRGKASESELVEVGCGRATDLFDACKCLRGE
ncbi:hypothetical protein CDD83_2206 [Cordyceps sp. RAO-2017]|nr:hypothetical protein CDD83_2206 [Cordyceps sp. RAO-2017]